MSTLDKVGKVWWLTGLIYLAQQVGHLWLSTDTIFVCSTTVHGTPSRECDSGHMLHLFSCICFYLSQCRGYWSSPPFTNIQNTGY